MKKYNNIVIIIIRADQLKKYCSNQVHVSNNKWNYNCNDNNDHKQKKHVEAIILLFLYDNCNLE